MRVLFSARRFSILALAAVLCFSAAMGEDPGKVNLNTATLSQLEKLPGIGPSLAERILEYRDDNGPFGRSEELMNVPGIGESKYLRIRDLVTVAPGSGKDNKTP